MFFISCRHLLGAGKVSHQVAELVGGQAVEEAFGHHREGGFFPGFNVALRDADQLAGRLDGDDVRCFLGDHALNDAAVGEAEDVGFLLARDEAAAIDDVIENVVEVRALRAGELGGQFTAVVEQLVAARARFRKEGTATRRARAGG